MSIAIKAFSSYFRTKKAYRMIFFLSLCVTTPHNTCRNKRIKILQGLTFEMTPTRIEVRDERRKRSEREVIF